MNKNKVTANQMIFYILLASMPLFLVLLVSFLTGSPFFKINPVNQIWNDENFYYLQIQSAAHYGKSLGYFGYNESRALYGGFGAWIPATLFYYVPWYWLFHGSVYFMYLGNMIMICLSLFLLFYWNRLSMKECLLYCIPLLTGHMIRYSWSGLVEPFYWSFTILIFHCCIHRDETKWRKIGILLCTIVSITRPHMILFFIPLCFNKKKGWISLLESLPFMLFSVIVYFLLAHYFTAAYLISGTRFEEIIQILKDCFPANVIELIYYIKANFAETFSYIKDGLLSGERRGVNFFLFYITLLLNVIFMTLLKVNKKLSLDDHIINFISVFSLFVIINVYRTDPADRQIFLFILFNWLYIIKRSSDLHFKNFQCLLAIILVVLSIRYFQYPENQWKIESTEEYRMKDVIESIHPSSSERYDNTIDLEFGVDNNMFHALYDVNPGIAVSICTQDFLSVPTHVHSKYVLISTESKNADLYIKDGWKMISQNMKCILLQRQ